MNKLLLIFTILALLILAPSGALAQAGPDPVIYYVSAKAGPNQGWENSATKGAAITIWGKNLGTSRGSSTVTVAGVTLNQDSDYAEWGATTNPTTAKGFQRITFWLNSNMPNGNTAGIYVTVNGVRSNTLPFKINNTGVIRFIDETNGNDAWDGQYKDHSLGGSHGPWKTIFMYYQRSGTGPGTFFYMRGGTYTNIFDSSSGHPTSAYIGYFEQGGTNCTIYYPQINGMDELHYTVTSYPGELAVFTSCSVDSKSNYWTLTNFRWTGPTVATEVGQAYSMGDQWAMCANCQLRSAGLDVIGMQFDGYMHHVIQAFGDNFNIVANYINVIPVTDGSFDQSTSYPLYLCSGNGRLVKDNEIHGGGMYSIHDYDESRCGGQNDYHRYIENQVFDSNLIDLTRNAINPQNMRAGIITGTDISGNAYSNVTIKNNVIFSSDNLVSEGGVKLFSETNTNLDGVYIYNNNIYNVPHGLEVFYSSVCHWRNVELKNNIFSNIGSYEIYVDGGSTVDIQPVFQYNLVGQTPRVNGNAVVSNNVIGSPAFVNAPTDFHLQSGSPAIDAGLSITSVTQDYDHNLRPQGSAYDLGAYEYASGSSYDTQPPAIQITSPTSNPTYSTASSPFSISGTASDNTSVSQVTWVNNRGGSGTATGTTSWSVSGIALQSGDNAITVTARDPSGNTGADTLTVTYTAPDTTPPVRSGGSPSGTLQAGTTSTTISLTTDEPATCRYSTSAGVAYSSMANSFSGAGSTSHSSVISGLQNGTSYSYYVRCQDTAGNPNTNDFTISFSIAVPGACIHEADSNPCNGCVEMGELNAYISRWQLNNQDVTLRKLMEAIGFWKSGTGCTVPACPEGQITSTCTCGGSVYSSGYCCSGAWQSTSCGVTPNCPTGQITGSCICEGSVRTSGYCCTNDYETLGACCPNGPITSSCYCQMPPLKTSDYCCDNFWSSGACS